MTIFVRTSALTNYPDCQRRTAAIRRGAARAPSNQEGAAFKRYIF